MRFVKNSCVFAYKPTKNALLMSCSPNRHPVHQHACSLQPPNRSESNSEGWIPMTRGLSSFNFITKYPLLVWLHVLLIITHQSLSLNSYLRLPTFFCLPSPSFILQEHPKEVIYTSSLLRAATYFEHYFCQSFVAFEFFKKKKKKLAAISRG